MKHHRSTLQSAVLVTLLALAACAPAATTGGGQNPNLLTREEIMSAEASNLYDVVQRLRPRWLTARASRSFGLTTDIVVYQGQTMLGGLDILRQLSPNVATRLRYLDGTTASASLPGLGSRHVDGAIIIETAPDR